MLTNPSLHSFKLLEKFPLIQGYFERSVGSMALQRETNPITLKKVLEMLEINEVQLKLMRQCHGNTVSDVGENSSVITEEVDGLVTTTKGIVLGVKTADCLPLLLYDPLHTVIGVCHAGYKGLLNGVIQNTLTRMQALGAESTHILVGIGPSICKSCYNVEEERIHLFTEKYPEMSGFYEKKGEEYFLDLRFIAQTLLETNGVPKSQIEFSPFCTKEQNAMFFSRRVESEGVFLSVIGML